MNLSDLFHKSVNLCEIARRVFFIRCLKIFVYFYSRSPKRKFRHNLPSELIVSLTSYPERFNHLYFTLKCLLNQRVQPNHLILWIAEADFGLLPRRILQLEKKVHYLEIRIVEDTRSYKKIIPALAHFSDAFIVTCDDDTYYDTLWLEDLVNAWDGDHKKSVCHRARIVTNSNTDAGFENYRLWPIVGLSNHHPMGLCGSSVFPTGVGGVLYPSGIFDERVSDASKFLEICPTADDVWLYWMVRKNGGQSKTTNKFRTFYEWPGSKKHSLYNTNVINGANDKQISAMLKKFPLTID